MKDCPHCGREIEDGAKFCLHCMTSLSEKKEIPRKKRIPVRMITAISFVTIAVIFVFASFSVLAKVFSRTGEPERGVSGAFEKKNEATRFAVTVDDTFVTATEEYKTVDKKNGVGSKQNETEDTPVSTEETPKATEEKKTAEPIVVTPPSPTETSSTKFLSFLQTNYPDHEKATVSCRQMTSSDLGGYLGTASELLGTEDLSGLAIVTKILAVPDDGVLIIPNEVMLNGKVKKVTVLDSGALADETVAHKVKTVVLPDNVAIIRETSLANCRHVTDVYFFRSKVYFEPLYLNFLPDRFDREPTIHCIEGASAWVRDYDDKPKGSFVPINASIPSQIFETIFLSFVK